MSNVKAYLEDIVRDGLHDIAEALKGGGPSGDVQASHVIYDNTVSGLTSNRVQGAIDELSTKADTNASGISDLGDDVSDLTTRVGTAEGDITALETWKDNLDASDIPYDSGTVKDALDKVNTVEILATTRDSYNGVWTLMRCGHTYSLSIYDTAGQQIPAGKINCPFAVDSSWLPIYYALTMSVSQSGHIWNVGATPTGISGWMYTADASQRFATVTWLK